MIEKCTCTWLNCIEEKKSSKPNFILYTKTRLKKEISSSLAFFSLNPSPHVLYYIPTFCLRAPTHPDFHYTKYHHTCLTFFSFRIISQYLRKLSSTIHYYYGVIR